MAQKKKKRGNGYFLFIVLALFLLMPLLADGNTKINRGESAGLFLAVNEDSLFRPLKKNKVIDLSVSAKSALSTLVSVETGKEKILFEKEKDLAVPIASISKLMTAIIVLENYNMDDTAIVKRSAVSEEMGTLGELMIGEKLTVKNLLYFMLIESDNGAAEVLAQKMNRNDFINLMNKKAGEIGLNNTIFYNPTGLDIENSYVNTSTTEDLKTLAIYIMKYYPTIPAICSIASFDLYSNGKPRHLLETTNELLRNNEVYLWGKTGYTKEANGCIILISRRPFSKNAGEYIIDIVLGANGKADRFEEAKKIKNWTDNSFVW
ncbi:MAG: serine hydrolase [Candidatus Paceibacterota bacterium]